MDIIIKTINLDNFCFNIIDTPGHMDFLPNLIKGLYQV